MPKELVHDDGQFSADEPTLECVVGVHWAREAEYVQIATTLVHMADHMPVERSVSGGWYVNLSRGGINDLIRNLRRARDQAFGRDE
jgi:hypothetical protein